jgi:hypothetical protein
MKKYWFSPRITELTSSDDWHDSHTLVNDGIQVRQILRFGECYRIFK